MTEPRLSIITPIYNGQAHFAEAVQCVLRQTSTDWEWLLIDDGSTDGSDEVARRLAADHSAKVRYLEHPGHTNHGQFATRVFGAGHARADVIAFLDQDDLWDDDYLEKHWRLWESVRDRQVHLSYGPGHYWYPDDTTGTRDYIQPMPPGAPRVYAPGELLDSFFTTFYADTPCPSCTLIRREALVKAGHLAPLAKGAACEDQYLWWFVAARWPVSVHTGAWARYRQHNASAMIKFTSSHEAFLNAELTFLRTVQDDLAAAHPGHALLTSGRLAGKIAARAAELPMYQTPETEPDGVAAQTTNGSGWSIKSVPRALARRVLSLRIFQGLSRRVANLKARYRLAKGLEPLSDNWGCERGEPICRRYLCEFLVEHLADVQGHCLEFQDDHYTTQLGGDRITRLDIINLEPEPKATIVADLTKPNDIPANRFDCIICTHVLHVIPDLDRMLTELHRILKPGGVLLVGVPHVSMSGPEWHELWRFTDEGLQLVLARAFGAANVTVKAYGNSLTAAGQLRGLVTHEFTEEELNFHDPRFAVEVCGRAVKRA
jgi:SAM-dependent methyltransferase